MQGMSNIFKKDKMKNFSKLLSIIFVLTVLLSSCSPADVASQNLSTDADNFKITRRIVFYNGITGQYMLVIEGKCSLGNNDASGVELSVTCKTGENQYKKHFLGLSDNVNYFAEQIDSAEVDTYHYKVMFRPEEIIPALQLDTSIQ